jgi:ERCC4-type nuclease
MNIKYNGRVGTQPKFEYSFPDGFVLITDTREQMGLFKKPPKGLLIVRDTLTVGDYSVKGFENEIVIERKSIPDLYNSLFSDWERELKKLCKISEYKRKWLVVEGSEDETLCWQAFSQVHPNSLRARLCAIDIRLGIPIHFATTRNNAERFILDRLIRWYRDKRNNKTSFAENK